MARLARVVVPGLPHHLTQRGNRRQRTFFRKDDYRAYLDLMAEWCERCEVAVWAYCLMPDHVHMIVVPSSEDGLRRAIGEAHRRYTRRVNFRQQWRGHLWQGRFSSFVMDKAYLLACSRYVERNPVRAGLCKRPREYQWSSAAAHLSRQDDLLVQVDPLLKLVPSWAKHLSVEPDEETVRQLRRHEATGRPAGSERFLKRLEKLLDRVLRPRKPGRKKNTAER
jgi:putative transposase